MRLLSLLNIETGAPVSALMSIISSAPKRYKEYEIPKRNGGVRHIAHPAKELKILQRIILTEILDHCPVSEIASAYVKGRGILYNAQKHSGQRWILKLDFKDFFHSITPLDWDRMAREMNVLSSMQQDRFYFHNLLFWGQGTKRPTCLSIGAPTSPMISNLVCNRLDTWLKSKADNMGLIVTRYADDITVSGSNLDSILKFENLFKKTIYNNRGLQLKINEKKRGVYGPGERRMVTGLILTPDGAISIGRGRKREIHSLVHRYSTGLSENETIMRTKGLIAFAHSIEPVFVDSLRRKYGDELLNQLLAFEKEPDPRFSDVILT